MREITQEEIDDKARWLVEDGVIMCGSWLMDSLIRDAEENPRKSSIDIDEYWDQCCGESCPNCGSRNFITRGQYNDEAEERGEEIEEDDFKYYCEDCDEKFDYPRQIEVFEYWFVSEFLARRLKERNEVILGTPSHAIWGRQTTGQAIYLDWVIQEIARDIIEYCEQLKTASK